VRQLRPDGLRGLRLHDARCRLQLDDAGWKALRVVIAVAFTAIGCALLAWVFAGGAK
jgi:hypothetical protein